VSDAVKAVSDKLNLQHQFEKELKEKEIDGELRLKEQSITSLSSKIKDLEASIKELSQKTATAESSVKDIAIKAIESSSKPYFSEKNKESSVKE
jgi:septal ring factor EnvC (AmiA/AmiB activator)